MKMTSKIAAGLTCIANVLAGPASAQAVVHVPPTGARPAGVPADVQPPFSSSVLVGDTLYLSGVLDIDPATRLPGQSVSEQTKLVLDALERSLKAAGFAMDDLVWVQVFATDLATFNTFSEGYMTYFNGPLPARSFVGVSGLMGGAHFEINAIAARHIADPHPQ